MVINGLTIKKYRDSLKLSQEELAEKLGLSRNTIYNYESEKVEIPNSKKKLIKDFFDTQLKKVSVHPLKPPHDIKELSLTDLDFVIEKFRHNFEELMKSEEFEKEFVFRASKWFEATFVNK